MSNMNGILGNTSLAMNLAIGTALLVATYVFGNPFKNKISKNSYFNWISN